LEKDAGEARLARDRRFAFGDGDGVLVLAAQLLRRARDHVNGNVLQDATLKRRRV
jgi:hypothetical protein